MLHLRLDLTLPDIIIITLAMTYQCLYNSMIGSIHMSIERKWTVASTIIGRVAIRSNDPILEL